MQRSELREKINKILEEMSDSSVQEVYHFAGYLLQKSGNPLSSVGLAKLMAKGRAFDFLENEPYVYTLSDCVEVYTTN